MNILIGTIVLFALTGWVWQKLGTDDHRAQTFRTMQAMVLTNLPRMMVALITAGLLAELLPEEMVRQYLGDAAGFSGIALGMVLGIMTPGGAFVSFALGAGALSAGAAAPAMISYMTAWALFSLTKMLTEEMAFLGPRFIVQRVAVSLPIPLFAGGIALALGA